MIIDLESIFNVEGLVQELDYELDMSQEAVDGCFPFKSPVGVKGTVGNETGIVEIKAFASFELVLACSRCAKEFTLPMKVDLGHTLVRELNDENNDDLLSVSDLRFDLDPLVKEDIFLNMPYRFLCSEACKGLCAKCGKDLNEGPCSCEKEPDPRLAALKQLLE